MSACWYSILLAVILLRLLLLCCTQRFIIWTSGCTPDLLVYSRVYTMYRYRFFCYYNSEWCVCVAVFLVPCRFSLCRYAAAVWGRVESVSSPWCPEMTVSTFQQQQTTLLALFRFFGTSVAVPAQKDGQFLYDCWYFWSSCFSPFFGDELRWRVMVRRRTVYWYTSIPGYWNERWKDKKKRSVALLELVAG